MFSCHHVVSMIVLDDSLKSIILLRREAKAWSYLGHTLTSLSVVCDDEVWLHIIFQIIDDHRAGKNFVNPT
jgi:hypothetical protein